MKNDLLGAALAPQTEAPALTSIEVKSEVAEPAAKKFQRLSFYPPGTCADDLPSPMPMIAASRSEAEHLRSRGWQSEETFFAARREQERIEREQVKEAEQLAATLRAEEESRRLEKIEQNKAAKKAAEAIESAAKAKRDAHEAKVRFLISASHARLAPLEEGARRAGDRFRAASFSIGTETRGPEIERLAGVILAAAAEFRDLRAKIDAVGRDYAADMAALEAEK